FWPPRSLEAGRGVRTGPSCFLTVHFTALGQAVLNAPRSLIWKEWSRVIISRRSCPMENIFYTSLLWQKATDQVAFTWASWEAHCSAVFWMRIQRLSMFLATFSLAGKARCLRKLSTPVVSPCVGNHFPLWNE